MLHSQHVLKRLLCVLAELPEYARSWWWKHGLRSANASWQPAGRYLGSGTG